MKQVFATRRESAGRSVIVAAALLAGVGSAGAAPIRGTLQVTPAKVRGELLGFTRTRVAGVSQRLKELRTDAALFLQVKESLPIPKPETPSRIVVQGLRLIPDVATCAVDATIEIVNNEPTSMTVLVNDVELSIEPGATRAYECTVGEAPRTVRLKEWPHVRGMVYVGEIGVAGAPDERGNFTLLAPNGQYDLLVINRDGVVTTRPIEVNGSSVNLGVIDLNEPAGAAESETP